MFPSIQIDNFTMQCSVVKNCRSFLSVFQKCFQSVERKNKKNILLQARGTEPISCAPFGNARGTFLFRLISCIPLGMLKLLDDTSDSVSVANVSSSPNIKRRLLVLVIASLGDNIGMDVREVLLNPEFDSSKKGVDEARG